jgi:hypothetical protein
MRERRELVSLLCSLEERSPAAGEASERAARRPKIALRAAATSGRTCPKLPSTQQQPAEGSEEEAAMDAGPRAALTTSALILQSARPPSCARARAAAHQSDLS